MNSVLRRGELEAALVFLDLNGHSIEVPDDQLVDLVLATTQGQLTKPAIAEFFRQHAQ